MNLCDRCGNELVENVTTCPYCGHTQKKTTSTSTIKPKEIKKVNIKIGLPTVKEAIRTAKDKLNTARRSNTRVVKLVHGYGSTGKGGTIRIELRKELEKMKSIGLVSDVIYGENFTPNSCKQLIRRFPDLKNDNDLNKGNKGITLVEL